MNNTNNMRLIPPFPISYILPPFSLLSQETGLETGQETDGEALKYVYVKRNPRALHFPFSIFQLCCFILTLTLTLATGIQTKKAAFRLEPSFLKSI